MSEYSRSQPPTTRQKPGRGSTAARSDPDDLALIIKTIQEMGPVTISGLAATLRCGTCRVKKLVGRYPQAFEVTTHRSTSRWVVGLKE